MYYLPILGALSLSVATILEKIALRVRKINIKLFLTSAFLASVLVMIPLIWFFWKVEPGAFELVNLLIFLGIIILSIVANLFAFYSLKWEKIGNLEPARVLEPLFTILLAIVFSFFFEGLYERNMNIIIPALIAAAALIFSHIKKHHLTFNKYFLAAVLGSFLYALELVLSRLILDFYSPISFYFLRCLGIVILGFILFKPKFKKLDIKHRWEILAIGALWVGFRVLVYYGYLSIGIIFTTLMIMLAPIFIYIMAHVFLKEKMNWRNIVASLVIAASVAYAILT
ncbi:EamA family transporter [Nanoarchaeota archaeon]